MCRSPEVVVVLLSACLVVKDEAARIEDTLRAVACFVDEIVVHDTGSGDGTVGIARGLGATVVEGEWNDSFADARNVALDVARGDWVLSLDADETCSGDPGRLRSWLSLVAPGPLAVTFRNSVAGPDTSSSMGYEFTAVRLFPREGARWVGRVHERVVGISDRDDAVPFLVPVSQLAVEHSGYSDRETVRRKGERNGRLAQLELDELVAASAPAAEIARTELKVGRAAVGAGQLQRAVHTFEAVRGLVTTGPVWNEATDQLARVLLGAGEAELGIVLAGQLEEVGVNSSYCSWLRAQGLAQSGRAADALVELDGVDVIVDTAGRRHDPSALEALRVLCRELLAAG